MNFKLTTLKTVVSVIFGFVSVGLTFVLKNLYQQGSIWYRYTPPQILIAILVVEMVVCYIVWSLIQKKKK